MIPVLFRDRRFAVLDKPAGMPVHGARNASGPSVEDCFGALGPARAGPWLAHRLDRDTAGCLVVALRRSALLAAQACFAEGRAAKTYWAVVRGRPPGESGTVRHRLARVEKRGAWRMEVRPDGAVAETDWLVRGVGDGIAWLELRPRTGRTHQVRAHCAALGCPVLGDAVYGTAHEAGLQLLARAIALPLDPPVAAEAPPPLHMRAALRRCGCESSWGAGGSGPATLG